MGQERALTKTTNFFHLYQHICGETEIPSIYHFWCCAALLAAALEDRCWFELFKDCPLKPNLYVCLIGPGSIGKGLAISQAAKMYEKACHGRVYRGKVTFAHLLDKLGKPTLDEWGREVVQNPRLWIIMDEFKNAVGSNKSLSDEFIALMTELYTATNYTMQAGTRGSGEMMISNPCINWIFGSNENWLRQILTRDICESGFVARTCFIYANYRFEPKKPKYPWDYEEVYEHLIMRLWALHGLQGRFLITPTAEAFLDKWYCERQLPEERELLSTWGRQREMLLRFAMLLCVAEGKGMVLRAGHLNQARYMLRQLEAFSARLIANANETIYSKATNDIEEWIGRRRGEVIAHGRLLRWARSKRGYDADSVNKALYHLRAEGVLELELGEKGGKFYKYVGDGV